MSVKISESVQQGMADVLNKLLSTSELTNCIVVTRTGLEVAPDVTADTFSASSSALIDLGERIVGSLQHGPLQEMVINALGGYVILVAIGTEYMLLGSTSAALKMGYYLPYLRKTAWELEGIIYGTSFPIEHLSQDLSPALTESPEAEPGTKITKTDIKDADMKAMDDVLAAFEEFGIGDDFASSLDGESVPSIGISAEEMAEINAQLTSFQDDVPDLGTTISTAPVQKVEETELPVTPVTTESSSKVCPIPLEAGEVAPYPLDPSEWNPYDEKSTSLPDTQQQPEMTSVVQPAMAPEPVPEPEPVPTTPITQPAPAPSFGIASEYDFDFDDGKDLDKDVSIPEHDAMSDALKALGWEEDDNS